MVNTSKLKSCWVEKDMTQGEVARKIGLSERVMVSRMKKKWFGSDEIEKLIRLLDISDPVPIFFAN